MLYPEAFFSQKELMSLDLQIIGYPIVIDVNVFFTFMSIIAILIEYLFLDNNTVW